MRRTMLMCLVIVMTLAPLAAHGEGIREERPNLVFGEIGGKAILFSAGYERYLTNQIGVGVGAVGWGAEDGGVGLFPIYAVLVPFGDMHSMYLSTGITYFAGYSNWDDDDDGDGWTEWVGTISAGYTYQSDGGFFVRPTMNMLYKNDGFVVFPGIAVGGSF